MEPLEYFRGQMYTLQLVGLEQAIIAEDSRIRAAAADVLAAERRFGANSPEAQRVRDRKTAAETRRQDLRDKADVIAEEIEKQGGGS